MHREIKRFSQFKQSTITELRSKWMPLDFTAYTLNHPPSATPFCYVESNCFYTLRDLGIIHVLLN